MNKTFKIIALCVIFAVVIVSVVSGVFMAKTIASLNFGNTVDFIDDLDNEDETVGMINFLLIGIDEDGSRSDSIMLFSYDGYSKRGNILSLHRDTQVEMNGYKQKLNAAMGVGIQKVKDGIDKEPEEELINLSKVGIDRDFSKYNAVENMIWCIENLDVEVMEDYENSVFSMYEDTIKFDMSLELLMKIITPEKVSTIFTDKLIDVETEKYLTDFEKEKVFEEDFK